MKEMNRVDVPFRSGVRVPEDLPKHASWRLWAKVKVPAALAAERVRLDERAVRSINAENQEKAA